MADTVAVKYLHPPNFDGNPPETNQPGWRKAVVQLTCTSDGTGESAVKKVDISDLRRPDGQPVVRTAVEKIEFDAFGFTNIQLLWDRAPRETIAVLAGNNSGCLDYSAHPLNESSDGIGDLTGDILLTSTGATSGDSYNIVLTLILK